jgi:hypothetical protein
MSARPVADVIEDLEFLNESLTGARVAAERTGFPTAEALEKWLERHGRADLWQSLKKRDPEGEHHRTPAKRAERRLMSVPTEDTIANLLTNGAQSTRARTRKKADRLRALVTDLRVILNSEAQEDEQRTQAQAEVERLTRELAEARTRLRGGSPTTLDVDPSVTAADLRQWARENDVECPAMGRVPQEVRAAYEAAQDDEAAS